MKSLVGAVAALDLFAGFVRPEFRAGRGRGDEYLAIRATPPDAQGCRPASAYYRLRGLYCPVCGAHRTEAVDALAEWPPSIPHEVCPRCRVHG